MFNSEKILDALDINEKLTELSKPGLKTGNVNKSQQAVPPVLRESSGSRYRSVNGYLKKKKIVSAAQMEDIWNSPPPLPQSKHFGEKAPGKTHD